MKTANLEPCMSHPIPLMSTPEYRAKLDQCIHCGLCLQACPTYVATGVEMDGPRGRIALMRAVAEGAVAPDNPTFEHYLTRCLACRACETACPSGVQYGVLFEAARTTIEHVRTPDPLERAARRAGLRELMPRRDRLRWLARLLWLYQISGVQRLVRAVGLPQPLAAMEAILPPITPRYRTEQTVAPAIGIRRGRVAFFMGCVQEAFLARVNAATIRVLQRNGYEVVTPPAQTCCGAAHIHSGDDEFARDLARRNIDAFLSAGADMLIGNAGGCGLALHEYPELLRDDPAYAGRAREFADRMQDITAFLVEHLHEPPRGNLRMRVVYADSCHLRHGLKVVKPPRELLRRIPGLELVELKQPDRCCGSAGIYNIVQPEMANSVLDEKMADVAATHADVLVTTNTGCYMQYHAGMRRAGLKMRVAHVVELLDESYRNAP
jgi:glycolate oxidase iron-sulfur subunit